MGSEVLEQLWASVESAKQAGDDETVILLAGRILDLDPGNLLAHFRRGTALANLKDYARALPDFEAYAAGRPDEPNSYFNRGLCYLRTGRWSEGERDFRRFLEEVPDDEEARQRLQECLDGPRAQPSGPSPTIEEAIGEDEPVTGRRVLTALGKFVGILLLIAAFLLISVKLGFRMAKEYPVAGNLIGYGFFAAFVVTAFKAFQYKIDFLFLFVAYVIIGLVNLRRGRGVVGFILFLVSIGMAYAFGSALLNGRPILFVSQVRDAIVGGLLILVCGGLGLGMMASAHEE